MNNRGFAITGILYTIFVLFLSILLSVLATISFKKGILEKTVSGLEDSFALEKVSSISNTYEVKADTSNIALLDGKYVFKTKANVKDIDGINFIEVEKTCSVYLKKGDVILKEIDKDNLDSNFVFVPKDCNDYSKGIDLSSGSISSDKLTLVEVYKFKESD